MFDKHETNLSVVNNSAHNPRHLAKVTDRDGKVILIQTELIRNVAMFDGGSYVNLVDENYFKLNLSVEELFDQIQSHLEKIQS